MASKISSLKSRPGVRPGNLIKKVIAILLSIFVLFFTFIFLNNADKAARDTVAVVRVKSSGLPAYTDLSKDNVEKYDIIKKEYSPDMILYEEIDDITDFCTAYYIRGETVLHKDQLLPITDKPLRNGWLYELSNDEEILTIPYNFMEVGGCVLMPGDAIRVRVTYETDEEPTEDGLYYGNYFYSGKQLMKTEVLFDSIIITDMINTSAQSIVEIYEELLTLNDAERNEAMKSQDFINSIKPKALLLACSKDQMDAYAKYKTLAGVDDFLITILSRANSYVVLDRLFTLENGVSQWLTEK